MGLKARTRNLIPQEDLLSTLRTLCQVFERSGIAHFISGGTLLGAVREKHMIEDDYDFDLDCLSDDFDRILSLSGELESQGIVLRPKRVPVEKLVVRPAGGAPDATISGCSIHVLRSDRHYGDIGIYTIFSDGIARRAEPDDGIYFNAKMSAPAWYYEGYTEVELNGEIFRTCREPEMMCEKVYGAKWQERFKVGDVVPGYNRASGSFIDSDIETLWAHALKQGWDTDYSKRPHWPCKIDTIYSEMDSDWIYGHQPDLRVDLPDLLRADSVTAASRETSPNRIAHYMRLFIAKTMHYGVLKEREAVERAKTLEAQLAEANEKIVLLAEREKEMSDRLRRAKRRLANTKPPHADADEAQ